MPRKSSSPGLPRSIVAGPASTLDPATAWQTLAVLSPFRYFIRAYRSRAMLATMDAARQALYFAAWASARSVRSLLVSPLRSRFLGALMVPMGGVYHKRRPAVRARTSHSTRASRPYVVRGGLLCERFDSPQVDTVVGLLECLSHGSQSAGRHRYCTSYFARHISSRSCMPCQTGMRTSDVSSICSLMRMWNLLSPVQPPGPSPT